MKKKMTLAAVADEATRIKERFEELYVRTNKREPDRGEFNALCAMLAEHKDLNLWDWAEGPGQMAITIMLRQHAPTKAICACWAARIAEQRREMGYESAPFVEQMLVDQILLCYLQLNIFEIHYSVKLANGMTTKQSELWNKHMTTVQKRFTRAVEALARVRKLTRGIYLVPSRKAQPSAQASNAGAHLKDARERNDGEVRRAS